jgi:hypothetical protein
MVSTAGICVTPGSPQSGVHVMCVPDDAVTAIWAPLAGVSFGALASHVATLVAGRLLVTTHPPPAHVKSQVLSCVGSHRASAPHVRSTRPAHATELGVQLDPPTSGPGPSVMDGAP